MSILEQVKVDKRTLKQVRRDYRDAKKAMHNWLRDNREPLPKTSYRKKK